MTSRRSRSSYPDPLTLNVHLQSLSQKTRELIFPNTAERLCLSVTNTNLAVRNLYSLIHSLEGKRTQESDITVWNGEGSIVPGWYSVSEAFDDGETILIGVCNKDLSPDIEKINTRETTLSPYKRRSVHSPSIQLENHESDRTKRLKRTQHSSRSQGSNSNSTPFPITTPFRQVDSRVHLQTISPMTRPTPENISDTELGEPCTSSNIQDARDGIDKGPPMSPNSSATSSIAPSPVQSPRWSPVVHRLQTSKEKSQETSLHTTNDTASLHLRQPTPCRAFEQDDVKCSIAGNTDHCSSMDNGAFSKHGHNTNIGENADMGSFEDDTENSSSDEAFRDPFFITRLDDADHIVDLESVETSNAGGNNVEDDTTPFTLFPSDGIGIVDSLPEYLGEEEAVEEGDDELQRFEEEELAREVEHLWEGSPDCGPSATGLVGAPNATLTPAAAQAPVTDDVWDQLQHIQQTAVNDAERLSFLPSAEGQAASKVVSGSSSMSAKHGRRRSYPVAELRQSGRGRDVSSTLQECSPSTNVVLEGRAHASRHARRNSDPVVELRQSRPGRDVIAALRITSTATSNNLHMPATSASETDANHMDMIDQYDSESLSKASSLELPVSTTRSGRVWKTQETSIPFRKRSRASPNKAQNTSASPLATVNRKSTQGAPMVDSSESREINLQSDHGFSTPFECEPAPVRCLRPAQPRRPVKRVDRKQQRYLSRQKQYLQALERRAVAEIQVTKRITQLDEDSARMGKLCAVLVKEILVLDEDKRQHQKALSGQMAIAENVQRMITEARAEREKLVAALRPIERRLGNKAKKLILSRWRRENDVNGERSSHLKQGTHVRLKPLQTSLSEEETETEDEMPDRGSPNARKNAKPAIRRQLPERTYLTPSKRPCARRTSQPDPLASAFNSTSEIALDESPVHSGEQPGLDKVKKKRAASMKRKERGVDWT